MARLADWPAAVILLKIQKCLRSRLSFVRFLGHVHPRRACTLVKHTKLRLRWEASNFFTSPLWGRVRATAACNCEDTSRPRGHMLGSTCSTSPCQRPSRGMPGDNEPWMSRSRRAVLRYRSAPVLCHMRGQLSGWEYAPARKSNWFARGLGALPRTHLVLRWRPA